MCKNEVTVEWYCNNAAACSNYTATYSNNAAACSTSTSLLERSVCDSTGSDIS